MRLLILSHADTSIKYFLEQHLAGYLESQNIRVSFNREQSPFDICLFSENTANLEELKNSSLARKYLVLDPKLNTRNQILNVENSDGAIVSSLEQAERVYRFQTRVLIQPWFRFVDSLNPKSFPAKKRESTINIVYHGNKVHLDATRESLKPALQRLSLERDIVFTVIYNIEKLGKWKHSLPKNLKVRHVQWNEATYLQYISEADIGVIPNFLPTGFQSFNYYTHRIFGGSKLNINRKDYLSRYKFTSNAGRLYEFALFSKPVVAEPTLSISQEIEHGKSGLLTLSGEGWYQSLLELVDDESKRLAMGTSLHEDFFRKHDKLVYLERFSKFLKDLNEKLL